MGRESIAFKIFISNNIPGLVDSYDILCSKDSVQTLGGVKWA